MFGEAERQLFDLFWRDIATGTWSWRRPGWPQRCSPAARRTGAFWRGVLDRDLRLLHPLMPLVTEAIWQRLPKQPGESDLLITAGWPTDVDTAALVNVGQAAGAERLIALVHEIRTARAEAGTIGRLADGDALVARRRRPGGYDELAAGIGRLARIRPSVAASPAELEQASAGGALSALAGPLEARLARSGADIERENARLARDLEQAQALLEQTEARLADERFASRAPVSVVDATRARAAELREQVARLSARLNG